MTGYIEINPHNGEYMHPLISPIVALVAGILILAFPALLNYIVAIYLIIVGITGLLGNL